MTPPQCGECRKRRRARIGEVRRALDSSLDEALHEAQEQMRESFVRPDIKEGVAGYLERRPPEFPPLG